MDAKGLAHGNERRRSGSKVQSPKFKGRSRTVRRLVVGKLVLVSSYQAEWVTFRNRTEMPSTPCRHVFIAMEKRQKWKWFWIGLAVRLLGLLFIWVGDGHDSVFRKSLVVLGLILSVGGIAVLRYLLISGFRKKRADSPPIP